MLLEYNNAMPTIRVPNVISYYTEKQTEFEVSGSTALEAVQSAVEKYPALKFHVLDKEGNIRRHFNIFVNGVHIRDLNGMETPLKEDDKVILMASAAGG